MKLINKTEGTLMFEDVNLTLLYDTDGRGIEIDDTIVERSPTIQACISNGKVKVVDGDSGSAVYLSAKNRQESSDGVEMTSMEERRPVSSNKAKPKKIKSISGLEVGGLDDFDDDSNDGFLADSNPTKIGSNKFKSNAAKDKYNSSGVKDIYYAGPSFDAGGYAKMNRQYSLGLNSKDDVEVFLDSSKSRLDIEGELFSELDALTKNSVNKGCIKINAATAGTVTAAYYNVAYTMMETEKVHPQYIERCNQYNEVWLPSKWCMEKFKESGLIKPSYYMPIGVDFENFNETKKPLDFNGKVNGFTFISVFGWSKRKGYDIFLKAFFEEFSNKDDVTFLVCSRYAGSTLDVKKEICRKEIRKIRDEVGRKDSPNIVYFGDVIPEKLMGNLYNSADCYVGISRGEGLGLPWLEGSMCGLPVIGSNYSGLTDFLTEENSFLVEPEELRPQKDVEWISYFYNDMPLADYGREAIDKTREHMRYIYENYEKAKNKNKILQKFIKENYNWDDCVNRAYNRIGNIYENMK